ncbi:MAG: PilZ domain-containing protein [Nitrospira sp.]|nr:PilZ domain-containing protein [Nitrospira sp.]MCB9711387.1 PilZ domain-containing protein [Nitrospiraceae bacterium]
MATNQREFTRVNVAIHVELRMGGNVVIPGELENVSLNGLLLRSDATVPSQTPCLVVIHLDGGSGGPSIEAKGHVVRTEPDKLAVQFSEILGAEGMAHLRNLVLFNSGTQADQVEAEFQGHVGLKPIS